MFSKWEKRKSFRKDSLFPAGEGSVNKAQAIAEEAPRAIKLPRAKECSLSESHSLRRLPERAEPLTARAKAHRPGLGCGKV